jgi:peptidoglycan-associated lipoprotein
VQVLEMKSVRLSVTFRWTVAVLAMLALAGGCKSTGKRGPAVAGPGMAQPIEEPPPGSWKGPSNDMSGGDVQPLTGEGISGQDLINGLSPEGGPLADILFEYDSAALTPAATEVLQKHVGWLKANVSTRAALEGHADERGTVEYNLALGQQRARAVYDYLTSVGIPAARLATVSFGKERPVDPGHDEAAWAKNRRVHFAVSR